MFNQAKKLQQKLQFLLKSSMIWFLSLGNVKASSSFDVKNICRDTNFWWNQKVDRDLEASTSNPFHEHVWQILCKFPWTFSVYFDNQSKYWKITMPKLTIISFALLSVSNTRGIIHDVSKFPSHYTRVSVLTLTRQSYVQIDSGRKQKNALFSGKLWRACQKQQIECINKEGQTFKTKPPTWNCENIDF